MKVALVHDYLSQDGGAERVLKTLQEIWPEAPIFVLFHDKEKIDYLKNSRIYESFIAKLPFARSLYQWYLPLMPLAVEKYYLQNFDVVISSTSSFAKGVIVPPHTLHISYCHTPPRYIWADTHDYVAGLKYGFFVKTLLPGIIHRLRLWDKMSADRVDYFIANSKTVRHRINKYYRRESEVIYPPVEINKFSPNKEIGGYFLAGGRLVAYKRLDIAVKAFNRLGWPLKIFGAGPELSYLQNIAKPNIQFLGCVSDEEKSTLMSKARAFIHPQNEDFGLTPIEAMASGRPVIAFRGGGAMETVLDGETGTLFPRQNWESLFDTLLHFEDKHWDSEKIREHAKKFEAENFKQQIKKYVADRYEEFTKGLTQEALIKI